MKSLKNLLLLLCSVGAPVVLAVPFDDDPQQFFVEGQGLNDTVSSLNFVLCMAAATRADSFVNDGAYVSTLYEDDCDTEADASSEKSSATATSAQSSTTAASASGVSATGKAATRAIVSVARADTNSPVEVNAWIPVAGSDGDPDGLVHMGVRQTGGVTTSAPNGNFQMNYQMMVNIEGEDRNFGGAFIQASESFIKFREQGGWLNLVTEELSNGDSRGVYRGEYFIDNCDSDGCDQPTQLGAYFQYYLNSADKAFCSRLISAELIVEKDGGPPTITDITDNLGSYSGSGIVAGETCYSTDRTKATRNVHRYGVYINGGADDGKRLEISNSGFPLVAEVTDSDGDPLRVHAYADYWGVWVEPAGRGAINNSTVFKQETYDDGESAADAETYYLKSTDIRIEKRDTTYSALNDLDGLSLVMYVADDWWKTEFTSLLGSTGGYEELEGTFDKDGASDGSGQFTFTKGISFSSGYSSTTLSSPISFSSAQWKAKMAKEYGTTSDDWYFKEIKQMGVWSPDTSQWYEVSGAAFSAPTSATSSAGVRTESTSIISPSDITETLYCFSNCVDGALVQQTFTQAVADGASSVATPFADVGSYLKSDTTATQVFNQWESMSEATDQFWMAGNTLQSTGFKLAANGAAVTDFIKGDVTLQHHMRIGYGGLNNYGSDDTPQWVANYQLQGEFSSENLNKLLTANGSDAGVVPVFNLDIKSIPTAGTTGSMKLNVKVTSGDSETYSSGDRVLIAETTVNYSSNGSEFVVTIPNGAVVDLTYVTSSGGSAITADYTTTSSRNFAYAGGPQDFGSVSGQSGLSWDIFQLFSGHSGLGAFNSAGIGSFFQAGNYQAYVATSNTSLSMEGPNDDRTFNKMMFGFAVRPDSNLSATTNYLRGEFYDGILASEAYSYSQASGAIVDQNSRVLTKGSTASNAFAAMDDPNAALQNVTFLDSSGWQQSIAWGIRTGQLVGASNLSKMECRKTGKDQRYDWHPVLGRDSTALRYCEYQIWEGGIDTTYTISLEATPSFSITNATTGQPVVISQPKTMYYNVPGTSDSNGNPVFGEDANKRLRLEYKGHGDLMGIPGYVYDTASGENLGEFVNSWGSTYRYLSRFTIPDGSLIEDGLDSTKSYKVKALDGEEWLTKADGTVSGVADVRGRYTSLYGLGLSDLLGEEYDGVQVGRSDNSYYIGAPPTTLINSGAASVVHGEVSYDPTP